MLLKSKGKRTSSVLNILVLFAYWPVLWYLRELFCTITNLSQTSWCGEEECISTYRWTKQEGIYSDLGDRRIRTKSPQCRYYFNKISIYTFSSICLVVISLILAISNGQRSVSVQVTCTEGACCKELINALMVADLCMCSMPWLWKHMFICWTGGLGFNLSDFTEVMEVMVKGGGGYVLE